MKVPGTSHLTGLPLLVALGTFPTVGDLIVDNPLCFPHLRSKRRREDRGQGEKGEDRG